MKSTITAGKLLANYYNISEGYVNNLTHKELLTMFPMLDVATEELLTNNNLRKGNIILVKDAKKEVLGYKNPYVYDKDNECTKSNTLNKISLDYEENSIIETDNVYSLIESLNDHELEAYMKTSKKENKYRLARILINELKKRSIDSKVKNRKLNRVLKREKWEE